ncbi:MAG: hypothetical protein IT562_23960 [Alphaproteobacteria bacterium]|nr:hypothetical protein [Alphaproteobacteria bacterium]
MNIINNSQRWMFIGQVVTGLAVAAPVGAQSSTHELCRALIAGGVFEIENVDLNEAISYSHARSMCNISRNTKDTNAGVNIETVIPLEAVTLPLGLSGTFSQKREQFNQVCDAAETQYSKALSLKYAVKRASPEILKAVEKCIASETTKEQKSVVHYFRYTSEPSEIIYEIRAPGQPYPGFAMKRIQTSVNIDCGIDKYKDEIIKDKGLNFICDRKNGRGSTIRSVDFTDFGSRQDAILLVPPLPPTKDRIVRGGREPFNVNCSYAIKPDGTIKFNDGASGELHGNEIYPVFSVNADELVYGENGSRNSITIKAINKERFFSNVSNTSTTGTIYELCSVDLSLPPR